MSIDRPDLEKSPSRTALTFIAIFTAALVSNEGTAAADTDGAEFSESTLIYNARVIDGSGADAYLGAVRIADDVIVGTGKLTPRDGERLIDAQGLVLTPGFIDTHSHHDYDGALREHPAAAPLLTQGITTAVFGQDGSHQLPLGNFLADFENAPAAVNIAAYVGHNTLRDHVLGADSHRPATDSEVTAMQVLLTQELDAGALGLSTGLEYEPGIYSERSEVLSLAKITALKGGRYISHLRSEDRFLWDAVDEIIEIGRHTGMPVQISHIKLAAKSLWNQSPQLLQRLDAARAEGINITADIYPYEYWQSTMWVLLPDRDANNLEEIAFVLEELTPASGIIFTKYEPDPSYVNQSVAQIAATRGASEVQTFSDLLKESDAWSQAHAGAEAQSIMGRSMNEADIEALLGWEHINICTDGAFDGHPRGHGAFPRVLARFVRDKQILPLETAIAAMTSRAAKHMGFSDRGNITVGMKADLVLFDPDGIQDHAGIRNGQLLSSGIHSVWVNGRPALEDGKPTGLLPGRVLRNTY